MPAAAIRRPDARPAPAGRARSVSDRLNVASRVCAAADCARLRGLALSKSHARTGTRYCRVPHWDSGGTLTNDMASNPSSNEVQVGAQGRLVIPAALRKALRLQPGDRLIARQEGDTLVLERRGAVAKRLQDRFRHIPREVCLVDELIAERRAAAAKEAAS